MSRRGRW